MGGQGKAAWRRGALAALLSSLDIGLPGEFLFDLNFVFWNAA
jgi:hypothetical protein